MESTRFTGVVSNFKDFPRVNKPEFIQVSIAIIDTSPRLPLPVLYILKRDLWDVDLALPTDSLVHAIGRDPLIPKGPVLTIDRAQKRIYLADNNVLVYNHLVSFTAPSNASRQKDPSNTISHGAVSTLMDALRCSPIRPPELSQQNTPHPSTARFSVALPESKIRDSEMLKRLKAGNDSGTCTAELGSADHWLFEVQT